MGMLNYEEHIKEHELIAIHNPDRTVVEAKINPLTGGIESLSVAGQRLNAPIALTPQNKARIVFGGATTTYSQSGTVVTVTKTAHGLTAAYDGGECYLTQSTGALLTGWFSGFTYVDANTFTVVSPVSQTTSGNIGTNTAETTVYSGLIAGGLLGANGTVDVHFTMTNTNTANNKTLKALLGNFTFWDQNLTTTTFVAARAEVGNFNASGVQIAKACRFASGGLGSTSTALAFGAVDTTTSQSVALSITLANAADWAAVVSVTCAVTPHA